MATFTVQHGRRYRATISLGFLESLATNAIIEERLRNFGFAEVRVSGTGGTRIAEALWLQPDAAGEVPAQVTELVEI